MKKIILFTISTLMLTGCGTYSRYHRADIPTEKLYRNIPAGIDTTTLASMSWREMFTDRKLQFLIETGLRQNTDLTTSIRMDDYRIGPVGEECFDLFYTAVK